MNFQTNNFYIPWSTVPPTTHATQSVQSGLGGAGVHSSPLSLPPTPHSCTTDPIVGDLSALRVLRGRGEELVFVDIVNKNYFFLSHPLSTYDELPFLCYVNSCVSGRIHAIRATSPPPPPFPPPPPPPPPPLSPATQKPGSLLLL